MCRRPEEDRGLSGQDEAPGLLASTIARCRPDGRPCRRTIVFGSSVEQESCTPQPTHSFIHIEHLYSASSRKLLRSAPNTSTVKQSCLKVRKTQAKWFC